MFSPVAISATQRHTQLYFINFPMIHTDMDVLKAKLYLQLDKENLTSKGWNYIIFIPMSDFYGWVKTKKILRWSICNKIANFY